MPVARDVIRGTDFAFKLALLPEGPLLRFGRRFVLPRLLRMPRLQRLVIEAISEVSVARRDMVRRTPPPEVRAQAA
jgi:hypothetical protein